MKIPVVIMAGGKAKRFEFDNIKLKYKEKTLLPFKNKYLIEHIIDTVLNSYNVSKVFIAVSSHTFQTKSVIETMKYPIHLINTPGIDYHFDLKYIINTLNLNIIMTISADLPLINSKIIDFIIDKYFILKKPALTLMANIDSFNQYGLKPTTIFKTKKREIELIPLGINIIDGRLIEQKKIEQITIISDQKELLFNINTISDYYKLLSFQEKNNSEK